MRIILREAAAGLSITLFCNLFVNVALAQPSTHRELGAAVLQYRIPTQDNWRTFAKPLALGTDSLLLFQRNYGAEMWRIDWKAQKVSSLSLPELELNQGEDEIRYTALVSKDGLWLLGKTSLLIRNNGQRLTIETKFDEPVAVVLNDQSVLVLGKSLHGKGQDEQYRLQQIRLLPALNKLSMTDRGLLSYNGMPNQPGGTYQVPRSGHGAIKLRDGRVLMFGGNGTRNLASLIESNAKNGTWSIKPVPPMPNEREFGVATVLPDGRVVVTGAPYLYCYQEAAKTRSMDVYEVKTNRWAKLAPLPFVPCADAHGADTPSITTTPNGSIVVGGYLEPQVMVLPRDAKSPTGYADSWQVYDYQPSPRISGVVQALSNQELVVAGGVDYKGRATWGFDLLNITQTASTESLAMSFIGAGVAKRGQWVFAASGRRFGFTGFGQMRYSAYAELIDLFTGKVRQLPNVPFASGAAQAFWLDDNRVLLKGVIESNTRGFRLNEDLSSSIPPSSAAMAIFHVQENSWSEPIAVRELERAQLIAADGNNAFLLSDTRQVFRLDLNTHKLEVVQPPQRAWRAENPRFLSQDKMEFAGSAVKNEPKPELESDCEVMTSDDCPEQHAGLEPRTRMVMVEALSLKNEGASTVSTPSAMEAGDVASTVTTAQGRIIALTQDRLEEKTSLVQTSENGKSFDKMPLPSELQQNCEHCTLVVVPDPRNPSHELIFLRQGAIDVDYIDDAIKTHTMNVWWWNEAEHSWRHVLKSSGMASRSSPLALGDSLSPNQSKRMMSMGWHLREPVLWMTP